MDSYLWMRRGLFLLPPEAAHHLTLKLAEHAPWLAKPWQRQLSPRLKVKVHDLEWNTPIGLAAGLDKNATALDFFTRLGFGSMECGTVTLLPQSGNLTPRLFRYPEEASLRNSMGFPNQGLARLCTQLSQRPSALPLAVNIGKSKNATPEKALQEYADLYTSLAPRCDWVVVNISSPNTPGLRDLQQEDWLTELFAVLTPLRARLGKGIFVKLSPDLDDQPLRQLTTTLLRLGVDGLVATNTTHLPERGAGGVSGRLLRVKAHQKRRVILDITREQGLPVVGVGGFEDMSDVLAWWAAGGEVFQIYTAFIYQGPKMLIHFEQAMLQFLDRAGLADLASFFALSPRERQKLIGVFGR